VLGQLLLRTTRGVGCRVLLMIGLVWSVGSFAPASAATRSTEFCAEKSPDGTLSLRVAPSLSAQVIVTLRNGDCGVWIRADSPRSGGYVQAVVNGRSGWVKSKWIVRIDKLGLTIPVSTVVAPRAPSAVNKPAQVPAILSTPEVIESAIDGDFEGWDGDTLFKLRNGQIWQQSSYDYTYHYSYSPKVLIYRSGSVYKMKVDGVDDSISVTRLK
jgi:hypothetical protein